MTTALLVGVGAVGTRAARQLVDTPEVVRVLLADSAADHVAGVADALGDKADVAKFEPGDAIPVGVDVVACALPSGTDHAVVAAAIVSGVPCATTDDDHAAIEAVRSLDPNARRAGITVLAGCGLAPGLSDVLARHAASMFTEIDEIRVARSGWAGPASVAAVRNARRASVRSWRDGTWREDHPHGDTLVWFPEPIGGRDCRPVTGAAALLVDDFPDVPRVSVLLGEPPKRAFMRRRFGDDGQWGAARVEVWGRRAGAQDCVVYGVVERTSVAAGAVLAVATLRLATRGAPTGVHGVGALADSRGLLAELAQRGVKAAAFEGVPVG
ncbi:MAG: hypothetical protein ACT4OX_04185 [Actinomycetota bacterium]